MRTILLLGIFLAGCNKSICDTSQLESENARLKAENATLITENRTVKHVVNNDMSDVPHQEGEMPVSALELAQSAYVNGEYKKAIEFARQIAPSDRTWRIIGASGCYLHDTATVLESRQHLSKDNEKFVIATCQRAGTKL